MGSAGIMLDQIVDELSVNTWSAGIPSDSMCILQLEMFHGIPAKRSKINEKLVLF